MDKDNLDNKLDRFSRFFATPISPTNDSQADSTKSNHSFPKRYHTLAERLGGELVDSDSGAFCLVRTLYPFGHRFGDEELICPESGSTIAHSAFRVQEEDGEASLRQLLFFDTETTGLGGSGAVAFLIGVGSLTAEGFEVRQYVLPDYSDETAMLEAIHAECIDRTLVSYNGAAFDVPLVRDRMIINRVSRNFDPEDHIDLLHPTRRLYRRRLGDCTLTNVEREVFGFFREDDIPGYLIPSVYFEWLGSESPDAMEQVLEHNRFDILALWFLAIRLHEAFATAGRSLDRVDDLHSLSRIYGRRKQHDRVAELYQAMNDTAEQIGGDAVLFHSLALKRLGRHEEAVALWEGLVSGEDREAYCAALELAKYYEHHHKDCSQALKYAHRASELAPDSDRHRAELERRVQRLLSKISSNS